MDESSGFIKEHALPIAKGAGLSGAMQYEASAIPEQIDALAFPPGHPTREKARAEFVNPDYYKSRVLPAIFTGLATAGIGHELGTLVTPRARVPETARTIINRGSQQSIDDLEKIARYRQAVEAAKGAGLRSDVAQRLEAAANEPGPPGRPEIAGSQGQSAVLPKGSEAGSATLQGQLLAPEFSPNPRLIEALQPANRNVPKRQDLRKGTDKLGREYHKDPDNGQFTEKSD